MNQAIQIENVLAREPTIFTISNMSFYVIEISNGIEYVYFGYKWRASERKTLFIHFHTLSNLTFTRMILLKINFRISILPKQVFHFIP